MRTYVVQRGDSPASIAARADMAGCPKCACELARTNPHKSAVRKPNGFLTFRELVVGETLHLPDEWFHPARDRLPPTYYQILPHADGVTPGALGTLGDQPALDQAVTKVAALAAMPDAAFVQAVGDAGAAIDAAAKEAYGASTAPDAAAKAKSVQDATRWAWQRNRDLAAAVAANNRETITRARLDIQNALATALGNARLAVANAPGNYPADLVAAAKAAASAIAADPNYCTSVTHPGTPVNAAVHRFKLAWNASQTPKVPIGTSNYEAATTVALAQVSGSAPSACGPGQRPMPAPRPPPASAPGKEREIVAATEDGGGWSVGAIAGAAFAAVLATGGVVYLVKHRRAARPKPAYA
jgi:hypothetical protein